MIFSQYIHIMIQYRGIDKKLVLISVRMKSIKMTDQDIFVVIVIMITIGGIIYGLFKAIEKSWNVVGDTILFIILIGALWYFEFSMKTLFIVATIEFFVESLMLAFANYKNKQCSEALKQYEKLLQLKYRKCAIYQNILAQGEQKLFRKTRKVSKKWIKQWDEGVKRWERSILEIKNPERWPPSKSNEQWPLMVEDICMQGYGETWFLYEAALTKELTVEQIERINAFIITFKKTYLKAVRLMRKNGIIIEKCVDPLTKKKRYKHTMLSLHWCLYTVDNMITAEYEQQQKNKASGLYEDLASMKIYYADLPKYTEYETLEEILSCRYYNMPGKSELLCICKRELLSLLHDISSAYKAARKTFIYYKKLIDTVREGYIAFDKDCCYSTVEEAMNVCRKKDKEKKKGLRVAKETPTFEKAYKLGAKEWMKAANEKCDNRLIFWEMLVEIEWLQKKLKIIFGDEKVKALKEAIQKDKEQFDNEIQAAIFEDKKFCYYKSRAYFIGYLE